MTKKSRIGLALLLVAAVGTALALTQPGRRAGAGGACCPLLDSLTAFSTVAALTNAPAAPPPTNALPRLVDVGANKCIPCKLMAPILEELKTEYAGQLTVEFIDVWKDPDAGKPYKIQIIPTQIFFDAKGKELFRHVGFFAKAEILAKWKELGVDLKDAK